MVAACSLPPIANRSRPNWVLRSTNPVSSPSTIMTLDADLAAKDAALRMTCLGNDNTLMGQKIDEYIKKAAPNGGKICTIEGNIGADTIGA